MQDYDKNNKPLVKPVATVKPFKMKDEDLAPVEKPFAPKPAFGQDTMPTNSVTSASSAKLQKAIRTEGRVNMSGGSAPFAK